MKYVLLVLLAMTGCSTIRYTSHDGTTFHYTRVGTQQIQGFEYNSTGTGTVVRFNKQEGGEHIGEIMGTAMGTMVKTIRP